MYDLIIIGGGPAGLTAGLYASRARLKTLLTENMSMPTQLLFGGKIENYPGFPEGIDAFDLIERFKKQAQNFGLEIIAEEVKSFKKEQTGGQNLYKITAGNQEYTALSVIVAVGAKSKKLDVPGEAELVGKGVSYCATCDGALYKDKNVVVVGGGDTAVEEALFLTKFARKVTIVHRRDRLRATSVIQEKVFSNKKIDFFWNGQVIEVLGSGKVESVRIKNINTYEETDFSCDGVFIFVGFNPNTNFLKNKADANSEGFITLDDKGYVLVDDNMKTSQDGVFACGDCREKLLRQVITACGDGATAAFSAQHYIDKQKGMAYEPYAE